MGLLLPHRLVYLHGTSPRTQVGASVYTFTEYPPEEAISMPNELSCSHEWTSQLFFYCVQ